MLSTEGECKKKKRDCLPALAASPIEGEGGTEFCRKFVKKENKETELCRRKSITPHLNVSRREKDVCRKPAYKRCEKEGTPSYRGIKEGVHEERRKQKLLSSSMNLVEKEGCSDHWPHDRGKEEKKRAKASGQQEKIEMNELGKGIAILISLKREEK